MNKIYLVVEDWRIDSGESGISTSAFSSIKKAKKYLNKLKEEYDMNYDTKNREKEITENEEEIEVVFEDFDYYKIYIEEKIIDFYDEYID